MISNEIVLDRTAQAELLKFAFNQICCQADWKAPIDAVVPWDLANVYGKAIAHMTGTEPIYGAQHFDDRGAVVVRITAIGYRAGPCGDH